MRGQLEDAAAYENHTDEAPHRRSSHQKEITEQIEPANAVQSDKRRCINYHSHEEWPWNLTLFLPDSVER